MKINADKIKRLMEEAGVSREQLTEALPHEGRRKQIQLAEKKVRNWLAGRDHPAAKREEIDAIAGVLGCEAKDIVRFRSTYRFSRSSPRKARLVAELIRGRKIDEAQAMLQFSTKRASVFVKKALDAAVTDAQLAEADVSQLVVTEAYAQAGPIIKRFRPKDRGRAHPIMKRTSHITVSVEEVA